MFIHVSEIRWMYLTEHPLPEESVVVIGETEFRKAESVFAAAPNIRCVPAPAAEDEFAAVVRSNHARYAVVGVQPYRDALYTALPRMGVIARFGVGHDGIDKARATAAGILCTNTPGVLNESVAEHTMTLILAASRHFVTLASGMKSSIWAAQMGSEISGKTLAIIGVGAIGRTVARMAAFGFGMRVVGCGRTLDVDEEAMRRDGIVSVTDDFAAAVDGADYVSLHIPATPANARFMNRERLAMLGSHCWLVNTARGAVVDENALYDALASGQVRGAAVDVFEREPYVASDPARDLRQLENVVLTPHMGSNTVEANARMAQRALKNIALAEVGDYMSMDLLNPQAVP
jgi:lactate dehydrogenase-like 2-hydroxyacid dehydrogenase